MALENSFRIFVRKTGEAPQEVHVTPATTVAEIKAQKDLKGYVCCFKGNRKDGDTMTTLGIQSGNTINVFKTAQNPAYQAAKRLQRGKAKGGTAQSTAHAHLNLHRQTQEVVVEALMTESQQTREAVAEVRADVQKLTEQLQIDVRPSQASLTYHVDHASIRTSLERGGFTATQLLLLHNAANLRPPMRRSANGADVPEKVKYQLAQSLCSAAGSGEHIVQSAASGSSHEDALQRFDYPTLASWMEAMRHQRPLSEWQPPALATLLEAPAAAKRKPRKRNSTDIDSGDGSGEVHNQDESKSKRQMTKSCSTPPQPAEDAEAIRKGYHPNFISGDVLDALWRYTLTRAPYHVHLRKKPVKSRPKINYGVSNENGEYGLYRWGQEKKDWHRVEDMPQELLAVIDEIEKVFGVRPNHAIATYYHNGKEQWIPVHQDKAVSLGSKGGIESKTTIFNLSLGAGRPFIITSLDCSGEKARGKLEIVDEFPMQSGDLYAMTGDINSRYGHCVAKDPSVQDLRVSYVFRCVNKDLVHPTKRYYREMNKKGWRISLPEHEAEPPAEEEEEEAAASTLQAPRAGEEVCACYLPSAATWWLPLPTTPPPSEPAAKNTDDHESISEPSAKRPKIGNEGEEKQDSDSTPTTKASGQAACESSDSSSDSDSSSSDSDTSSEED